MGVRRKEVIEGSTTVAESQVELAFSEDDDVVAGPAREGCGWCPIKDFEKVGPGADLVTVRTMHEREFTRHRDMYAVGEATANVFVAKTTVVSVRPSGSHKKKLEGKKALEWIEALAVEVPAAVDLLGRRQIQVSQLRRPEAAFPEFRVLLGYPARKPVAPDGEEEARADGDDSKSEPASG